MNKRFSHAGCRALLGFVILAIPVSLWGQAARGSIAGSVKDTSGAVVPAVSITVTEEETGTALKVTTQQDGSFLAPQLQPGSYKVTAEAGGFKRLVIDHL